VTDIAGFRKTIYRHYRGHGRTLPWRETNDPYRILVSEIMLQQTQVERVLGKYPPFIEAFPDFKALAAAPLYAVLSLWRGMGYNRRALQLKKCAFEVVERHTGRLPDTFEALLKLPGVGKATAGSIMAFAFNRPAVFIETNIRRVFLHFFFPGRDGVSDAEILPLVERTLDRRDPRVWYYALMDYGVMLKKKHGNMNVRSRHYKKQPAFKGSRRQIRGEVLRLLVAEPRLSEAEIVRRVGRDPKRARTALASLAGDGLIVVKGSKYSLPERHEEENNSAITTERR
jgi:A/G-specific adenine glycosylase